MTTRVINHYTTTPPKGAINIMRPSRWGSPFALGVDGDRTEILYLYREWLGERHESWFAEVRKRLAGRTLVCCCAPLLCHGDFLAAIADGRPWPELPARQGTLF